MNDTTAILPPKSDSPLMHERRKGLFAAVINQFLSDLKSANVELRRDAARFFNTKSLDMYLENLGIDPEAFREKLVKQHKSLLRR